MLAGAYLTMSTAVGIIGADIIATGMPALSRFVFAFIFAYRIGLRSHFQLEVSHFKHDVPLLVVSIMAKSNGVRFVPSFSVVLSLILSGALILAWFSINPSLSTI